MDRRKPKTNGLYQAGSDAPPNEASIEDAFRLVS